MWYKAGLSCVSCAMLRRMHLLTHGQACPSLPLMQFIAVYCDYWGIVVSHILAWLTWLT